MKLAQTVRRCPVLVAFAAAGCGHAPDPEGVAQISSALVGYDPTASYAKPIGDTWGWEVEWEIPQLTDAASAWTAIGEWYYNLESGIYHSLDGRIGGRALPRID